MRRTEVGVLDSTVKVIPPAPVPRPEPLGLVALLRTLKTRTWDDLLADIGLGNRLAAVVARQLRHRLLRQRAAVPGAPKALAVIEIENLSQDPSLDWLGYGVVDLLTTDLAQAKDLDVISTERIRGLVGRQVKPGESLPAGCHPRA